MVDALADLEGPLVDDDIDVGFRLYGGDVGVEVNDGVVSINVWAVATTEPGRLSVFPFRIIEGAHNAVEAR